MATGALVLATQAAYKEPAFNPMQQVGSITAVQRVILTFRRAKVDYIVLVMPQDDLELERHVAKLGAIFLHVAPGAEMLDGVKRGLAYLQDSCQRILITPVDIPLFTVDTVKKLLVTDADVANPVFNGKRGHPLMVSSAVVPGILQYVGTGGLAGAVVHTGFARTDVPVGDEGILLDLEETEEYAQLLRAHSLHMLHPEIKLRLALEDVFFGPGTCQFLRLIALTGSVRSASAQMGLSYSKAWKMLKRMEDQLGHRVVERQQGGKNGGQANLTPLGSILLERYERFEEDVKQQTEQLFTKHFEDFEI